MCDTELAEIRNQLQEMLVQYGENYEALYRTYRETVTAWRYGRGGTTIHRGWFCPSPVRDKVFGNASRGKLLKNPPKSEHPADYVYGFDAEGELRVVEGPNSELHGGPARREVIVSDGDRRIGLQFEERQGKKTLCGLSICVYEKGNIVTYITALRPDVQTGLITTFEWEQYQYEQSGELIKVRWIEWTDPGSLAEKIAVQSPLIRERTYILGGNNIWKQEGN